MDKKHQIVAKKHGYDVDRSYLVAQIGKKRLYRQPRQLTAEQRRYNSVWRYYLIYSWLLRPDYRVIPGYPGSHEDCSHVYHWDEDNRLTLVPLLSNEASEWLEAHGLDISGSPLLAE